MAQQGPFTDDSSKESAIVNHFLQWTSGTTGAVATINRQAGFGLVAPATAAVVQTGTGLFTLQFEQPWSLPYLAFDYSIKQASYAAAGACVVQVLTDNLMATTGVMTIEITNAAGAAVNPTTGDIVRLNITMQAYTAGY